MTAHVSFILERRDAVISIPRPALLRTGGQNQVIVRQAGQWVERPVKTGLQTRDRIEIVSGLNDGETIVADKQAWKEHLEKNR